MAQKCFDLSRIEEAVKKLTETTPTIVRELERRAIKKRCEKCDVHKEICEAYFDESKPAPTIPLTSVLEVAPCGEFGRLGCIAFDFPFTPLFCNELETALSVIDGGLMSWAGDTSNAGIKYLIKPIKEAIERIERDIILASEIETDKEFYLKTLMFCEFYKLPNAEKIIKIVESINSKLSLFTAAPPPITRTTAPLHFNSSQHPDKLTAIFESLKDGGYFDANADLGTWLYICGVADLKGDFWPLNWVADKQLLGIVITKLFDSDKRQYWKVAQQVFLVGGNKLTKNIIDGIKNSVSKITNDWRNAPPQASQLLTIIAGEKYSGLQRVTVS